jgi:serine/threonine protein phosphatase PrpC
MPLHLETAARSDIGLRRRENQDRHLELPAVGLFAVADGMGGMPHGSEAADATLAALQRLYRAETPYSADAWEQLVHAVNRDVVALGRKLSPVVGIGSTLTVLQVHGERATIAHVGDSAAFRLRAGDWTQLTSEHTVGARARRHRANGGTEDTSEGADHVLTSCIGAAPLEEVEILDTDLRAGDRYLLCSDGITKPAPGTDIRDAVARASTPANATEALIALANHCGGPDNATAVVLFC